MQARVLIVDDDPIVGGLLAQVLSAEGYDPNVVGDGKSALGAVRRHRPDLVITDVRMPTLGGLAVRAALWSEGFGEIPILFISGGPRPAGVAAEHFIAKPFDLAVVLQVIRRRLAAAPPV